MDRRQLLKLGAAAATVRMAAPATALAQAQYPDRPIRVVVPFAAGGVVDAIGRLWAEKMQPVLGTFVVENRGGASGTIGAAEVARAAPDGYTMLLGNTSTQVLNPAIMPNPPYDAARDFAPIGIIANSAISIAVNPSFPARTLPELIAYAKANPDKISYGSAGAGTFTNLAGEMFKQRAGLPTLTHIPYKGGGPATTDVVSGHIPMMMINITNQILELHKTGKIRIIAVFNPQRLAMIPEVPAATELLPGLIAALFIGLFAPAATPKWILDRVAAANRRAMESEDLKRKLVDAGFEPVLDTPQEAQRFMAAEYDRIVPLVKALDFKLQ
ncbi:MAG: tripartite tricarboxylate transporter substrate binding protein [Hyphomicrobiales bacterium]|nr:tripartite tricarboxylate transporter substrate binding protein [Hyphomicrobiales bacterium]